MPVFLSHKREDKMQALSIANYLLKTHGIKSYVDVFDPTLNSTTDITATLMQRVRQCSHIMAVVSDYTTQSWWVPFEVGVASELDRRITSYRLSSVSLPDFLNKWPILYTFSHLDIFARYYKNDISISLEDGRKFNANINSGDIFHATLKQELGQ